MVNPADFVNANILIVDDQASNVDMLEQLLAESGYVQVTSTSDPTAVCAMHRKNSYDLILLDLQMPVMDGFQVIEALKAIDGNDYFPVIVLTAQPGHKRQALLAGVSDFISKPLDLMEVKMRIHNMLEVRLLYKKLAQHNQLLERAVEERTADLRASEARYRSLTELASDWYWEQDANGDFTKVFGPVQEMLGIRVQTLTGVSDPEKTSGWNEAEREELKAKIADREPFLDFPLSRILSDGSRRVFKVSGEPMFDRFCNFIGYRGVGLEIQQSHS